MTNAVKVKRWGRFDVINIVSVYGSRDGTLGDDYIGDVNIYPPSQYAIDNRGKSMFAVRVRFDHIKPTFHKTEANAVKRMRRVIREYYGRV